MRFMAVKCEDCSEVCFSGGMFVCSRRDMTKYKRHMSALAPCVRRIKHMSVLLVCGGLTTSLVITKCAPVEAIEPG